MSNAPDREQFVAGYHAAKRFYGTDARWQLDQIAREVTEFRAAWPSMPPQLLELLDRLDNLATQGDRDRLRAADRGVQF